jgi:hypothetical protein
MYVYGVLSMLNQVLFLRAFPKLRKAAVSFLMSVYLFICPQCKKLCSYWTDFYEI